MRSPLTRPKKALLSGTNGRIFGAAEQPFAREIMSEIGRAKDSFLRALDPGAEQDHPRSPLRTAELELEQIQSHMTQKPLLRGEVGCACVRPAEYG